jgi:hypothetical protein
MTTLVNSLRYTARPAQFVTSVGIDDLNVYGSTLQLHFADLAAARGLTPRELQATQFDARSGRRAPA